MLQSLYDNFSLGWSLPEQDGRFLVLTAYIKVARSDQHSSLLQYGLVYGCKKFYDTVSRTE